MADMDNFSLINENFDTIKTLLNSIRAQGILNTSDVDKLLSGINSKLEKINTDEDIDLIKIFLSELKQNLDERHSVLVSKFGAIESLFSNLLKNSSEMPKSADIKELFDIVATNLSVFSREVVSQKESLTDITLRLDALRSDDSQKKDIIKNIALLKPDLERLNNGFDSIVISLNDNFKTIIKTITAIDKTEHLDRFADSLKSIEMSSNTVLSALQVLDKKAEQVDESLQNLATKDDITLSNQRLFELTAQSHELTAAVNDLSDRYVRVDNLADKVDASVNIIASLKSFFEGAEDSRTSAILEQLRGLEQQLQTISSDTKFDEFKEALTSVLKGIADSTETLDKNIIASSQEIQRVVSLINSLDINVSFKNLIATISKVESDLKTSINEVSQRITTLQEANITRILNDISSGADSLSSKLNQTQSALAVLCEKNFGSVYENITDLKNLLSQIDENSVSANNAIFSSITDRLTLFENGLRTSLEAQEKTVNYASAQLVEQIDNIKNLSSVLDYKMDSSVVEVGNIKREFGTLKTAVEEVLALDFVTAVKDLRVDLYASKQELINNFESTNSDLSQKITDDLYGKYELLISKLDYVEDEFKKAQAITLVELKNILEKISSSIVDVLSYVSEASTAKNDDLDAKIANIANVIKANSLDYVESVRDVVDVIRVQVETNLKNIEEENSKGFDLVKKSISENTEDLKKELKYSYSKLLELQDSYSELKEILNVNSADSTDKLNAISASTADVKLDFESKLSSVKSILLDKISDFKQEFTCENADKMSELKFSVENLYNKNSQEFNEIIADLRKSMKDLAAEDEASRVSALTKIMEHFASIKDLMNNLSEKTTVDLNEKVDAILEDFSTVKGILDRVDENIDGDMTRQLSIIESNFESLVSQMSILFDKSDRALTDKINDEFSDVSTKLQDLLAEKLEAYKVKIENTFEGLEAKTIEQSKYLQERIADLNIALKSVWEEQAEDNMSQIQSVAEQLKLAIDENIKLTAVDYVALKNKITEFAQNIEQNNEVLTTNLKAQLDDMTKYIDSVIDIQAREIDAKHEELSTNLSTSADNIMSKSDSIIEHVSEHKAVTDTLVDSVGQLADKSEDIISKVNEQKVVMDALTDSIGDLSKDSNCIKEIVEEQRSLAQNSMVKLSELTKLCSNNSNLIADLDKTIDDKLVTLKTLVAEISAGELQSLDSYVTSLLEQLEAQKLQISTITKMVEAIVKSDLEQLSGNIEKETDVIIAELIEQFDLMKKAQADDVINLTSRMEDIVNAHIYNSIEDLKSYLDVKTDNSVQISKLDNLKIELTSSVENIINDLNKLLDTELFTSAISDFRVANEVLVTSAVDRLNDKIAGFIKEQSKEIDDKFALFDKKFIDTVVDKYEEVKILSNSYNDSLNQIKSSINDVMAEFGGVNTSINKRIDELIAIIHESTQGTNQEVINLCECFNDLRSQISNKSFDEAFQASINKQIASLEELVNQQLAHIEDISELCANNLPDVAELNTLVKHSVLTSVQDITDKISTDNYEEILNQAKADIITQFLNVFNQISFVAEQEEILDFIQDKHDELITILSHIVTTSSKIDSLKEDIDLINEKINAIISSEGDVDYVYSLQDLESDIANLRIVLNEMKDNDHGQEFAELISSTNEIYDLVESIKSDLPSKTDFDTLAEDIVSISTRTNKLILASDESYKTLQDNLQDFKLVINDLDERTRNFAQEAGIDRIDSKLNAINSMMVNGAKTNQVFNQVFEYLAEWVDNASTQINDISNRVETLDDIEQIKTMLTDLKEDASDNSESIELIEALGEVFDKQAKRISSLETKLDKIIVETTINNKNNKLDLKPMEDTLNRFLVVIDEKICSQQDKINSLELKLESVLGLLDEKDTALLTKKVGGMDRQIAKLNKSIEKIASHVVEK